MKALIFAAGKGTRLKPFTDFHPKALAKVNGVPLLQRNIEYLKSFGITDFVINIHHFGDQIIDFLNENNGFGSRYEISDESQALLETGGGLLFAKEYFLPPETCRNLSRFNSSLQKFATIIVSFRSYIIGF